jgi:hypothetical protein
MPDNTKYHEIQNELQIRIHKVYILSFFEMLRQMPSSTIMSWSILLYNFALISITPIDSSLVKMMITQATLFSLQEEVQVRHIIGEMGSNLEVEEQCAACAENIEFKEPFLGVCNSGHYWSGYPANDLSLYCSMLM